MKWNDAMRAEALSLYAAEWHRLGEEEFWRRFEIIKSAVRLAVEEKVPHVAG